MKLIWGDSLQKLKDLPTSTVDACVTDPPYGLSFMNKHWDYDVPSVELWREVLRVLKPGGHLLSFGGTRTYHRMVVSIEDAGFEVRDQIQWIYGSGFPKSLDVSKAIDKANGDMNKRPILGKNPAPRANVNKTNSLGGSFQKSPDLTSAASAASAAWEGWGTALKPANEPIVLARKPLEKGLTVAANVLKWGTGAINVDGCRIGSEKIESGRTGFCTPNPTTVKKFSEGRWPANVLFDEEAAEELDRQSGVGKSTKMNCKQKARKDQRAKGEERERERERVDEGYEDSGGASRFFYVAKASKRERNAGLEGMPEKEPPGSKRSTPAEGRTSALGAPRANHHPTVKPIRLMEYLCKLITPPGGIVLDPFMGSGSTGVAAKGLGFGFIGIEREEEYVVIAKARVK